MAVPRMGKTSPSLQFLHMAACMRACMCACMCAYVHVWLCLTFGLSQNIEFHGHAIPGAVGVLCSAIPDHNADANQRYFREIFIWR